MGGSNRHLLKREKNPAEISVIPTDGKSELEIIVEQYEMKKSLPRFKNALGQYFKKKYQDVPIF